MSLVTLDINEVAEVVDEAITRHSVLFSNKLKSVNAEIQNIRADLGRDTSVVELKSIFDKKISELESSILSFTSWVDDINAKFSSLDESTKVDVIGLKTYINDSLESIVNDYISKVPLPSNGKDGDVGPPGKDVDLDYIKSYVKDLVDAIPISKDGIGIASAIIDRNGELFITCTNGETKSLGVVVGKDGAPGLDGKDGAPGLDGKDGAPGLDGKDGSLGETGLDGKDGAPGLDGKDGAPGEPGLDGKDGAPGLDGKDGAPGEPGLDGKDGELGSPGLDGKDGAPGEPGLDGKDGAPGEPGLDGKDGAPGEPGLDGKDGAPGEPGLDGKDGAPGLDGKDGAPGEPGLDGKDGAPGLDGKDGASGLDGKDGAPGLDGKDGSPGLDGKDGSPGLDGKDGAPGLDGKDAEINDERITLIVKDIISNLTQIDTKDIDIPQDIAEKVAKAISIVAESSIIIPQQQQQPIVVNVTQPAPVIMPQSRQDSPKRITTHRDKDGNLIANVSSLDKTISLKKDDKGGVTADIMDVSI